MERRAFFAGVTVGIAGFLAGCQSQNDPANSRQSNDTPEPSNTDTATQTATESSAFSNCAPPEGDPEVADERPILSDVDSNLQMTSTSIGSRGSRAYAESSFSHLETDDQYVAVAIKYSSATPPASEIERHVTHGWMNDVDRVAYVVSSQWVFAVGGPVDREKLRNLLTSAPSVSTDCASDAMFVEPTTE